jgi:glycosyltransferase involved in cell wall biosynthesis
VIILQVHNFYRQAGGEDAVVSAEKNALEECGHEVIPYYRRNEEEIAADDTRKRIASVCALVRTSLQTLWNRQTYREVRRLLRDRRPDVVHCHNIFPLISPAIYWACQAENIPVIQTLHNYRHLCLNAFLFRWDDKRKQGTVCEKCLHKRFKWPGIRYACYRQNRLGSFVVASMIALHLVLGTWRHKVDRYVVLSSFQREKMLEAGWDPGKIVIKPNPVASPEVSADPNSNQMPLGPYLLYVGRLSVEKGVDWLLREWALVSAAGQTANPNRLVIVGDGPEAISLQQLAAELNVEESVEFLGRRNRAETARLMKEARILVAPSACYETFGLVVQEAARVGTPAIVAAPGAVAELVQDAKTGFCIPRGTTGLFAEKMAWALEHEEAVARMGAKAIENAKMQGDAMTTTAMLMAIYDQVLSRAASGSAQTSQVR